MDPTTAKTVLYAITGVGVFVWLAALLFFNRASGVHLAKAAAGADRFDLTRPPSRNRVFGSADVEGDAATLAAKSAAVLAKEGPATIGHVKILERTDDRVVFEGCGPASAAGQSGPLLRHGQLRLTQLSDQQTRIDYAVELAQGRGLLIAGVVSLVLGVLALLIGFWVIETFVVSHPQAEVRKQTFQMCQVVHFLWPPFLFGGLYRRRYTVVRDRFDAMIHNLPYAST